LATVSALRAISRTALAVAVVGVLLTVATSRAAEGQYGSNERRLLGLRVKDAAALLAAAVPSIQTPLASAAELASATNGDPRRFESYVSTDRSQFVSVSLWNLQAATPKLVASVGSPPLLASRPARAANVLREAAGRVALIVTGLLTTSTPRLGYAYSVEDGYVVYAESALPKNRRLQIASSSAFAGLDYALYLGTHPSSAQLLATNLRNLPVGGRHATAVVPFGDSAFTLVMKSRAALTGSVDEDSPWIALGVGLAVTLAAAVMTERLVRQRRTAQQLAEANRTLYREQRDLAEMLQRALLPVELPTVSGVEIQARYVPGVEGIDVGGDWYDVIQPTQEHILLMIGDVCGRGPRSAVVMASLRHSARAYAAQGDPPAMILTRLSQLLSADPDGTFATVLCAAVSLKNKAISVANAGHLPLLCVHNGHAEYLLGPTDPPIGVSSGVSYQSATHTLGPSATLLAFTDGLVERRGERLDQGLARLATAASAPNTGLDDLISRVVADLVGSHPDDDTAILGLRWVR
jgi:serine phosphatase RsbU (regulator of sigma subunit)